MCVQMTTTWRKMQCLSYQCRDEDKQGVAIQTKQMDEAGWSREVFEDYIQGKRHYSYIAVKHTSRPGHQTDVIVKFLILQFVCYIGNKCTNGSRHKYQGSADPERPVSVIQKTNIHICLMQFRKLSWDKGRLTHTHAILEASKWDC